MEEKGIEERVKNYVDKLFSDIPESQQLSELMEEVNSNLLEKVSDLTRDGNSQEEAFTKAISELGDVSELADTMRKSVNDPIGEDILRPKPGDKKHIFARITPSIIFLLCVPVFGVLWLKTGFFSFGSFRLITFTLFVSYALTLAIRLNYPMKKKKAFTYSLAMVLFLTVIMVAGIIYYQGLEDYRALAVFIPFILSADIIFVYLSLKEKG